jgi:hypothetical protein
MGNIQNGAFNPELLGTLPNGNSNNTNMILQIMPYQNQELTEQEKLNHFYNEINRPQITPLNLENKLSKRYDYLTLRHRLLNIPPPVSSNGVSILERNENGFVSMGISFNNNSDLDEILHAMFIILYGDSTTKKPIKEEIFNSFPKKKYSELNESEKNMELVDCQICQTQYESEDEVIILPECNHYFHSDCIKKWLLEYDNTCPLCRKKYDNQIDE